MIFSSPHLQTILRIRKLVPEDWEKFRRIRSEGLVSDPHAFFGATDESEEAWKERFGSPNHAFYAVEENGRFIATVGLNKEKDGVWMLVAVYTLPRYRGNGIGRRAIQYALSEAEKLRARKIVLLVNQKQEAALGIYRDLGFTVTREETNRMADGNVHAEYFMERAVPAF